MPFASPATVVIREWSTISIVSKRDEEENGAGWDLFLRMEQTLKLDKWKFGLLAGTDPMWGCWVRQGPSFGGNFTWVYSDLKPPRMVAGGCLSNLERDAAVMNHRMEFIITALLNKLGPALRWMSFHYSCWRNTGRDFRITGETPVLYKSASILLQKAFLWALKTTREEDMNSNN